MRLKRKYSRETAQKIYERFLVVTPNPPYHPLAAAFRELREEDPILRTFYNYAYIHLTDTGWTMAARTLDYVKGFLKVLDSVSAEDVAYMALSAHERMILLEEEDDDDV